MLPLAERQPHPLVGRRGSSGRIRHRTGHGRRWTSSPWERRYTRSPGRAEARLPRPPAGLLERRGAPRRRRGRPGLPPAGQRGRNRKAPGAARATIAVVQARDREDGRRGRGCADRSRRVEVARRQRGVAAHHPRGEQRPALPAQGSRAASTMRPGRGSRRPALARRVPRGTAPASSRADCSMASSSSTRRLPSALLSPTCAACAITSLPTCGVPAHIDTGAGLTVRDPPGVRPEDRSQSGPWISGPARPRSPPGTPGDDADEIRRWIVSPATGPGVRRARPGMLASSSRGPRRSRPGRSGTGRPRRTLPGGPTRSAPAPAPAARRPGDPDALPGREEQRALATRPRDPPKPTRAGQPRRMSARGPRSPAHRTSPRVHRRRPDPAQPPGALPCSPVRTRPSPHPDASSDRSLCDYRRLDRSRCCRFRC